MRTKLKKLTSACLAVIMILGVLTVAPITAGAAEETGESVSVKSGDFEYELYDDDTLSITRYSGNAENLTIPSEIDGYTVVEIGWNAFFGNTRLKSVTIPDTVKYIGGYAFQDCENLASATIPDSVTSIGYAAFANTALSGINIPSSVTSIGNYAFGYVYDNSTYVAVDGFTISGYTNSRAEVYANDNGFKFVSVGEIPPFVYELNYDDTISITGYKGREENLTIPSEIDGYTVTEIGWYAFSDNTKLKSVTIPDTVTYIDGYAFADCQNLKSVTIPASVTEIGEYAFGYVYDEDEWEYVKADGFTISGYTNSSADVYASDNGFKFVSLGEISPFIYELFEDGTVCITGYRGNSGYVSIPTMLDGHLVRQIGWGAFLDCPNVKSVEISSSVQYIADYAVGYIYSEDSWEYEKVDGFTIYGYTNSEAEVYAKENGFKFVSLGTVSPYAYDVLEDGTASITKYRGSETDLTIPSKIDGYKVTQIGGFYKNENLKSVTLPDTVTYIERGAFAFCTSLAEINIPDSVTYIGGDAFAETKWYENQPDGMVYAGDFAYAYKGEMPAGTTITLKNGTKGIVGRAFSECEYLKGITIPDSVTFIGECSFMDCTSLESVTIPDSVTLIEYAAFAECTKLKSVKVSKNTTEIGWYAFCGCTSLKSVTVPASVTYIGEYAFGYIYDYDEYEYVKADGFTISGYSGSEAEKYAKKNGFTFVSLGIDPMPKLGDVNSDGSISIDDATAIQKYLANMLDFTDEQAEVADVNMDGDITIDDVTLVQKYLAGLAEI